MPWSQLNLCLSLASLAVFIGFRGTIASDLMDYVPFYLAPPLVLVSLLALLLGLFTLIGAWKRKGPPVLITVLLLLANLLSVSCVLVHAYATWRAIQPQTLEQIMDIGVIPIVDGFLRMVYPKVQSIIFILLVVFIAELTMRITRKPASE